MTVILLILTLNLYLYYTSEVNDFTLIGVKVSLLLCSSNSESSKTAMFSLRSRAKKNFHHFKFISEIHMQKTNVKLQNVPWQRKDGKHRLQKKM